MRRHAECVLVILVPLLFVVAGSSFQRGRYSNDPEYIYLLNALNITQLNTVGNAEHPGTTVMEFGAIFLAVSHWFDSPQQDPLVSSVLKDPDRFVGRMLHGYIFLNGLFLFVVGWLVFRRTGNPWAAILFQLPPFFSDNILEHTWTKTSPEQLLLLTSTLVAGLLVLFHFDEKKNRSAYVILFSFLSGFGLATKWTFLPLVIIPLVILPGLKRRLFYGAGVVASFAVFTLPAIDLQLPDVMDILPSSPGYSTALSTPGAEPALTAANDGAARLAPTGDRGPEIVWNGLKLSRELSDKALLQADDPV